MIVETDGHTTVIHLAGSLCCATAPALREAIDAALDDRPDTVVLDLADAHAADELGLWVLPAMAGDAGRQGIALVIAAPPAPFASGCDAWANAEWRSPIRSP